MDFDTSSLRRDTADLLLTGGAGFLGSHFLRHWLRSKPDSNVMCLVRGGDAAKGRLLAALDAAAADADEAADLDDAARRVTVVSCDLLTSAPGALDEVGRWIDRSGHVEVVHCAANLSFLGEDRDQVWSSNVGGTKRLLEVVAHRRAVTGFNYVSTAYVAGTREGLIFEDDTSRPPGFNNVYEESKWECERIVRSTLGASSVPWRIFRPSIVIAHSRTRRPSAVTGFYKVVETLQGMRRLRPSHDGPIEVPTRPNANLNLIPVDIVAAEMLGLIDTGSRSVGHAFHLTNPRPLTLADVFLGVGPQIGLELRCITTTPARVDPMALLLARLLRPFMPYLGQARLFDRSHVERLEFVRQAPSWWLDLTTLRAFAEEFLRRHHTTTAVRTDKEMAA